jgi:hypothetical protein
MSFGLLNQTLIAAACPLIDAENQTGEDMRAGLDLRLENIASLIPKGCIRPPAPVSI